MEYKWAANINPTAAVRAAEDTAANTRPTVPVSAAANMAVSALPIAAVNSAAITAAATLPAAHVRAAEPTDKMRLIYAVSREIVLGWTFWRRAIYASV